MKRQRVTIACQKCRALKAKCDGQQPSCDRCAGYGFTCTWASQKDDADNKDDHANKRTNGSPLTRVTSFSAFDASDETKAVRRIAESYESLIRSVRPKLAASEGALLDVTLECIRKQLPSGTVSGADASPSDYHSNGPVVSSPTYYGKASDMRFLNTIRDFMREQEDPSRSGDNDAEHDDQSYLSGLPPIIGKPLELPTREIARNYLDIYFSTIHIAYPFLCKPTVLRHMQKIWSGDFNEANDRPWLALLNSIFAIGAYYTSFPRTETEAPSVHLQYFEQSLFFSNQLMATSTVTNVWILLTQCFFLLAICQTDRCWNTLGLAIRMGQSIGLHVEYSRLRHARPPDLAECETRRRVWYSMYVLDRLLALQLGRPFAMYETDFDVKLPYRTKTSSFDAVNTHSFEDQVEGNDRNSEDKNEGKKEQDTSVMDYFLSVIQFSHIVSQVIRELYHPTQVESSAESMLLSTSDLDRSLVAWRAGLPRHLRYDLGHTFEKSVTFKRQRNMLAVKFHHLRALIHRPFLCLRWLQRSDSPLVDLLQRNPSQFDQSEKTCISEAQQTAHLLHNIVDERSLMHDFPWWQMISCLICASSILLVAGAFLEDGNSSDLLPQDFYQDAETCLKVFEALSVNLEAARKATDMLKGIKRRRVSPNHVYRQPIHSQSSSEKQVANVPSITPYMSPVDHTVAGPFDPNNTDNINWWHELPSEMSNTMAWSAQFFQPGSNLVDENSMFFNIDDSQGG